MRSVTAPGPTRRQQQQATTPARRPPPGCASLLMARKASQGAALPVPPRTKKDSVVTTAGSWRRPLRGTESEWAGAQTERPQTYQQRTAGPRRHSIIRHEPQSARCSVSTSVGRCGSCGIASCGSAALAPRGGIGSLLNSS